MKQPDISNHPHVTIVEPEVHLLSSSLPHIVDSYGVMEEGKPKTDTRYSNFIRDKYAERDAERSRDGGGFSAGIIEFAGRGCYDAFGRKNPDTDSYEGYIGNIMEQKHFSVLEHTSFTFHIQCSRAATHEIVRHRHLSFSQESQRYVAKPGQAEVIIPPAIIETLDDEGLEFYRRFKAEPWTLGAMEEVSASALLVENLLLLASASVEVADGVRSKLKAMGKNRKQASEAARAAFPNEMSTKIVVTGNARSWLEFIDKRDAPGADAELQGIAKMIHELLAGELPEVFSNEARQAWSGTSEQKEARH